MSSLIDSNEKTSQIDALPFSLDEAGFKQWIGNLSYVDRSEKLSSVVSILNIFSQIKIPVKLRFLFLKQLSPLLHFLCQQLEENYINSHYPFSEQNQLIIELSAQAHSGIARNYALLCEDSDFNNEESFPHQQKALIIFRGIEAQAKVMFYFAFLYKKPDTGFWSLCFLFYLFAKNNNVLNFTTDKNNTCFINTFKQILLFELSNTQQFNGEEISIVFRIFKSFSNQVALLNTVPEKKFKGLPFLDLRNDLPPSVLKEENHEENPYLIHISCLNLIKQLVELSAKKSNTFNCSKPMLLRLIKTLTMNQQRKNERALSKDEIYTIIGFDNLLNFLHGKQEKDNSNSLKAGLDFEIIMPEKKQDDTFDDFRSERDANLTIATNVDPFEIIKNDDIWPSSDEKSEQEANADILDKSMTGFRLCLKDKSVTTKIGDIIGLMISNTLVISIIRRIIPAQENEIQLGIEKLGTQAKYVLLSNDKETIFLESNDHTESVVMKAHDFENEDYLLVNSNTGVDRYKVEKQLHASSIIKHLKLTLT